MGRREAFTSHTAIVGPVTPFSNSIYIGQDYHKSVGRHEAFKSHTAIVDPVIPFYNSSGSKHLVWYSMSETTNFNNMTWLQ